MEKELKEAEKEEKIDIPKKLEQKQEKQKTKLSYKETKEFEVLTKELPKLEARKAEITAFFESNIIFLGNNFNIICKV